MDRYYLKFYLVLILEVNENMIILCHNYLVLKGALVGSHNGGCHLFDTSGMI